MGEARDCNFIIPNEIMRLAQVGRESICPEEVSRVSVGMATCGQSAGALNISKKLAAREDWDGVARVVNVGCLGSCYAEPLVDVRTSDGKHYFFGKLDNDSHGILSDRLVVRPLHHT